MMKFTFNINKRHVIVILLLLVVSGFGIAQTPNPGHEASEVGAGDLMGSYYSIPNGNLGVGVSGTPSNSEGWGRVIDLYAPSSARLSVRAGNIDGRILAHTSGVYGATGMIIGTASLSNLNFITNGIKRMEIDSLGED